MARPRAKDAAEAAPTVPRSEAAPSAESEAPYRFRPTEDDVARFLDHVRRTGQPETFATLCRSTPSALSRPVFLRQFSVERSRRPDGDEAPCPICSPNDPKYLHDAYLVWYPDEGVIRAIGPECGDSVFGGTAYAEAKGEFEIEERERRATDFIERNLPKVLAMVVALEVIRPAVLEAERLYSEFTGQAPRIHEKLRRVRGAGGLLEATTVFALRGGPRGLGSAGASRVEVLGGLHDTSILMARLRLKRDWNAILTLLSAMPKTHSAEEAYLWMCDYVPRVEMMEKVVATLRRCSASYVKLVAQLDCFGSFFSRPLFHLLDEWGRHEGNDFNLSASVEGGAFGLRHRSTIIRYGRTCHVVEVLSTRPDLAALSVRGDWPGFE
jgi:hypothetical protein